MCSAVVYVAMLEAHLGVRVRRPLTHSEGLVSSQLGLGAGSGERSDANFCASIMLPLTFILPALVTIVGLALPT